MKTITIGLKKANHDGTAVLVVDGKEMLFNYETSLNIITEVPRQEIIEEGIDHIEVAASSNFNRDHRPKDKTAKWFRDELGQLWVKFTVEKKGWDDDIQYVIPADRVVQVAYLKSTPAE